MRPVVEHLLGALDGLEAAAALADGDGVANPEVNAGHVGNPAVDGEVAVGDQLPRLGTGGAKAGTVDDVVEAQLQPPQQLEAGLTLTVGGVAVVVVELGLLHAVDAPGPLLGAQLDAEVGHLAAARLAVLAGRVGPALEGALGVALLALEVELLALAAAEPADGVAGLARHQTLLRFGGRQPLCGTGVTSLIEVTSSPAAWSERIAASRPEPGPLT